VRIDPAHRVERSDTHQLWCVRRWISQGLYPSYGPTVFAHVCRMGLEGIVSKRMDASYRSGPSKVWFKSKNPASEAVRRERE